METSTNYGRGFVRGRMHLFCLTLYVWLAVHTRGVTSQGQEEILTYKIQEESDVGSFVGNVARDSQLYSRFSQNEFQQLQYSISSRTSKFTIDENTSTIRTGQVLDREVECQFNSPSEPCELQFDVGVYKWDDSMQIYDLLMIVHVTVILEDINDNSPEFPRDVVVLSVPESVPVGHVLLTSGAVDMDTGPQNQNSIKEYRLLPDQDFFRLQVTSSVDGVSSDLGIVVEQPLDRETMSSYFLQVVASDGGFPQRSGSVNITVNVQDVNDNVPTFSKELFNITVNEDSPTGVAILRFNATDPDSSHNGALTYSFSSRTSQKILDQFAVDPTTGDLILTKALDFEKDHRLQFMVMVRDHGSPEQQSQAAVIINVADVNDNAPQIDITLPPAGTNIAESLEVGSFIAHVSLSDADAGKNGEINCAITNDHFRLEKFSDFSYIYKILLERSLDYEVARRHQINVTCSDRGNPPLHNASSFTIHVRDENDNAPIFSKPEYHISVRENMDPGVFVFQVIAMDPDSKNNGNITYLLLDNPESAFAIDPVTGNLRALVKFDRERRSSYRLIIQARDKGVPAMSSSAIIDVDIDDVNDSPTRFAQSHFDLYVEEEQPKGSVVDTLRVVDLDNVPSQQLQFSFAPDSLPSPQFHVNAYTGNIVTTRPLDRERGDTIFDFKVFVVDAENVMFNDSASVTVKVTDINDHAPNITFPSEHNNSVKLPFDVPAGTIITRVQAHDLDRGENGTSGMTFGLESGDVKDIFLMNGINGELILTRRLHSQDVGTYHLRVSVQDSGRVVQKTTIASLDVIITGSNTSGLLSPGAESDDNIVIVVTLICVTVALALAVLATICIIRRIDRERKHHTGTKMEEQNIYKQETLPPASVQEKTPTMENYENEIEKLKRKIKRELSFVSDDDMLESSGSNGTTSASFSTFKKTSPTSTIDPKMLSSPQASSSILHSSNTSPIPDSSSSSCHSTSLKRVHYLDNRARDFNRLTNDSRSSSPAVSPTGLPSSWGSHQQQYPRSGNSGLTVRTEGEDAGSHTSASTSDSGRGGSSEDDVHTHPGITLAADSGDEPRHYSKARGYLTTPSLSTFRNPASQRNDRGSLSHLPSGHQSPPSPPGADTSLNGHLPPAAPRSYLQAHSMARNISFSDDSVTANTTIDCHDSSLSKRSMPSPVKQSPRRKDEKSSTVPRGILTKDGQSRFRSVPQQTGRLYGRQPSSQHRQSPPLPLPPDLSPLENRSVDDSSGVRGKVVSFSVEGDSYHMTPRKAGSSSRLAFSSSPSHSPSSRQSSGVEEVGGSMYANQTGHSSLGQPYSLADMRDVLHDSRPRPGEEDDKTTTTSGSYTINPDDLCSEIDNLFFNDAVV